MKSNQIPILVVSCDRYADLWNPFFKIFWNYWPDCPFPVYLGTNFKKYNDERVKTILVGEDLSWAAGVLKMLDGLKSEYILLFLEDFLLKQKVDTKMVLKLIEIARQNQVGCLRLVSASHLSFPPTHALEEYPGLGVISAGDINRVSTQVALWKTETLMKLLNPHFDPWQFEEIGSILSEELPDQFWGTYHPVILYDQGVERGKWRSEGVKLCRNMGIEVDLTTRPTLSEEEVNRAPISEEFESVCNSFKRSAVLSFKAGERIEGLKSGLQLLFKKPLSLKIWTLIFFGLLGRKSINWLFRRYATYRVSKIEKQDKIRLKGFEIYHY
jgi:hypothetical protein